MKTLRRLAPLAAILFAIAFLPAGCQASTGSAVVGHSAAVFISQCSGTTSGASFQWYKNGTAIPGATVTVLPAAAIAYLNQNSPGWTIVGNSAYVIATVAASDQGAYTCVVTNAAGNTTSDTATLNVVVAPSGATTATWSN